MEWLSDILHRHGALVVFAVVFAEQLGLPVPALPLLVAAGVFIGAGYLTWPSVLGAALLATLLADGIWYAAGQWRGRSVLTLLCRIALEPASCIRRTETFFRRHGAPALLVAKFVPGLSTLAPPLAGVMGLSLSVFLLYDGLGTVVWVGSSLGLGYLFSDSVEYTLLYADQLTTAVALLGSAVVAGYLIYRAVAGRRLRDSVPRITAEELIRRLESDHAPLLVDVRGREAVEGEAGLPGALHVPPEELDQRQRSLPRDRELVLYCACPGDAGSANAALRLRQLGFHRVAVLAGGVTAWQAAQRPAARETVRVASLATS